MLGKFVGTGRRLLLWFFKPTSKSQSYCRAGNLKSRRTFFPRNLCKREDNFRSLFVNCVCGVEHNCVMHINVRYRRVIVRKWISDTTGNLFRNIIIRREIDRTASIYIIRHNNSYSVACAIFATKYFVQLCDYAGKLLCDRIRTILYISPRSDMLFHRKLYTLSINWNYENKRYSIVRFQKP